LRLIQPTDQTKQTALACAVVADQTDAGLAEMQTQRLKHHRTATLQRDPLKRKPIRR
jgi:hypothetical protein